jgi:hypothetical protein
MKIGDYELHAIETGRFALDGERGFVQKIVLGPL